MYLVVKSPRVCVYTHGWLKTQFVDSLNMATLLLSDFLSLSLSLTAGSRNVFQRISFNTFQKKKPLVDSSGERNMTLCT